MSDADEIAVVGGFGVGDTALALGYVPEGAEVGSREWLRGVNQSKSGEDFPRLSRKDYVSMLHPLDGSDGDGPFLGMLAKVVPVGSKVYDDFRNMRSGVRRPTEEGKGLYTVQSRPSLGLLPDTVPNGDQTKVSTDGKVKTYTLSGLFLDSYVAEKYGLSQKFMASLRLKATTDPPAAARQAQETLQERSTGGVRILVKVGKYAKSEKTAADAIVRLAGTGGPRSVAVETVVIGEKMFMFLDSAIGKISVRGPLKHAVSVAQIYSLVESSGPVTPIYLLASETTTLGIDVFVDGACVSPGIVGHCKEPGLAIDDFDEAKVSGAVADILARVSASVHPLFHDGEVVATSVQLEHSAALVNQHVKDTFPRVTLRGMELVQGQPVADDLWAFLADGYCGGWNVREPDMGEAIAILYHDGKSAKLSPQMRVTQVFGNTLLSVPDKQFSGNGLSGGAVISLADGALLAIHRGATAHKFMGILVSSSLRADVVNHLNLSESQRSATAFEKFYDHVQSRGMVAQVKQVIDSLEPITSCGQFVGTAVATGAGLVTTVPAGIYDDAVFIESPTGIQSIASSRGAVGHMPAMRSPELFERVLLMGKDDGGVFMTKETIVAQAARGAGSFVVRGVGDTFHTLRGAVVLAYQDLAVLGQYIRANTSQAYGDALLCTKFRVPDKPPEERDLVAELSNKFPMLSPVAWDLPVLERSFNHSSLLDHSDMLQMAAIGDAVLRTEFLKTCEDNRLPYSLWQVRASRALSNMRLSAVGESFELIKLVRAQVGVSFTSGAKVHADALEALIALVYRYETPKVFVGFLEALGLLSTEEINLTLKQI